MSVTGDTMSEAGKWIVLADQVGREVAWVSARHDREETFVTEGFRALKTAGFFKALVPQELGGAGADYREMCRAIRCLARHCSATALAFSMHCHLVAFPVWRWRHEKAPVEGLLKRIVTDDLILISSGGSDWLNSGGTATKVDGGFRIRARKAFASGCPMGDMLMTSAVFDDPENGPTVLHFGLPFKAEGVKIADTWHTLGMCGTGSHDVLLEDVFVPDAAIAARRKPGKWHPLFHGISMIALPMVMSAYAGVADSARAKALELARNKANATHTVALAGRMENAFATMELAFDHMMDIAETCTPGPVTTHRALFARTLTGRSAIETVERAMELAGGMAFYRDVGLERAFRDVQGARFHPLSEAPQIELAGRSALGLDIDG